MGRETGIEWCHASWNPLRGCSRVSEGCRHCYAEREAHRHSGPGGPYEGLTVLGNQGVRWTGKVIFVEEHLQDPLRWRTPKRIFVNSMSDLFHESVPDNWIDRVFAVMALSRSHKFIVLTKRPQRMVEYCRRVEEIGWAPIDVAQRAAGGLSMGYSLAPEALNPNIPWPLPNVCLGVSIEDQQTADERIPLLLETPAAIRCVSYEPALGTIDLTKIGGDRFGWGRIDALNGLRYIRAEAMEIGNEWVTEKTCALDWVIVGGESGPKARPFDVAWARNTIEQCQDAGIACFVKQLGARPYDGREAEATGRHRTNLETGRREIEVVATFLELQDRKGGDMSEWAEDLRVRQFPAGLLVGEEAEA